MYYSASYIADLLFAFATVVPVFYPSLATILALEIKLFKILLAYSNSGIFSEISQLTFVSAQGFFKMNVEIRFLCQHSNVYHL